jgi:hypothetical protein
MNKILIWSFTGDMVNNVADEFKPFIPLFSKIKAKDGKFAVLEIMIMQIM